MKEKGFWETYNQKFSQAMKEHPTFDNFYNAIDGCRKFLRGSEPLRLHPYRRETLEDFSDRLPKDKVWQLKFSKYGSFEAEAVDLGSDDTDKL